MQDRVRNACTTMDVLALGREFVSLAEDGRESAAGWPKTTYGVSKMLLIAYGIWCLAARAAYLDRHDSSCTS